MSATLLQISSNKTQDIFYEIELFLKREKWREIRPNTYGRAYLVVVLEKDLALPQIAFFGLHAWGAQVSTKFSFWGLGLYAIDINRCIKKIILQISQVDPDVLLRKSITSKKYNVKRIKKYLF